MEMVATLIGLFLGLMVLLGVLGRVETTLERQQMAMDRAMEGLRASQELEVEATLTRPRAVLVMGPIPEGENDLVMTTPRAEAEARSED